MEDALGIEVAEAVRGAAPADLLRRVAGEPRPARLHAPRARLPRLRGRDRDGPRRRTPSRSSAACGSSRPATSSSRVIGGRAVHPVNLRVGGFYRAPTRGRARRRCASCSSARARSCSRRSRWAGTLDFPDHELDCEMVSLRDRRGLPDRVAAGWSPTAGLDIGPGEFPEHVVEEQVEHSTALHARIRERGNYLVGPLARYSLNSRRAARRSPSEAAPEAGLGGDVPQPVPEHHRPLRRDALRRRRGAPPDRRLRAARTRRRSTSSRAPAPGRGWTEAPRGMLWHRYELAADGTIERAHDRPPDLAEPGLDRGRPTRLRRSQPRPRRRRAAAALRAGGPQLRPLHLLLDPLPAPRDRAASERSVARRSSSGSATGCAATTPPGSRSRGACAGSRPDLAGDRARARADRPDRALGGRGGWRSSSTPSPGERAGSGPSLRRRDRREPLRGARDGLDATRSGSAEVIELARSLAGCRTACRVRRRGPVLRHRSADVVPPCGGGRSGRRRALAELGLGGH